MLTGRLSLLGSGERRGKPAVESLWLFHSSGAGDHALPDYFLSLKGMDELWPDLLVQMAAFAIRGIIAPEVTDRILR